MTKEMQEIMERELQIYTLGKKHHSQVNRGYKAGFRRACALLPNA